MDHTSIGWTGPVAIIIFVIAMLAVMTEGKLHHFRKSKFVLLAAGLIWGLIALGGDPSHVEEGYRHAFGEVAELFFFLVVAISFVNVLEERKVFDSLRSWLERSGFSLRSIFWLTGICAFFISPVADNMTTALIMGSVVAAVAGRQNDGFLIAGCVNVVVAANAGGAFSPFGDITTLMVWQQGVLPFFTFFHLFVPSLITWGVTAVIMSLTISSDATKRSDSTPIALKPGAWGVVTLFALTIATSVAGHQYLHLPAVWGMLMGLAVLKFYGRYLKVKDIDEDPFDVFNHIRHLDWDTLLFFVGVIMAVAGISYLGYLEVVSTWAYGETGVAHSFTETTFANVSVGIASAFIDNIPLMFAILQMDPEMSVWQWLLVTLTAGVGGSLLSIGSAAGVALMGKVPAYTFRAHLRHTPAVFAGYVAGIGGFYAYAMFFAPHLFG